MSPKYLMQDERGNSGQYISLTQGESKIIKIFPQNADGTPFVITDTISEIVIKIYTGVSTPSLQKKLSLSTVTKLLSTDPAGCMGFECPISATDSAGFVANSSGLPILITVTTSVGVIELNIQEGLLVDQPVVLN